MCTVDVVNVVSIGGRFTGKPHHEVSLFLLSVSIFCSLIPTYFIYFFVKNNFRSLYNIMQYIKLFNDNTNNDNEGG